MRIMNDIKKARFTKTGFLIRLLLMGAAVFAAILGAGFIQASMR